MVKPQKTPAEAIIDLVMSGTKPWAMQRKAEERHANARANRHDRLVRRSGFEWNIKSAAYDVLPGAYLAASNGGTLPESARQIYYAARGEILKRTGKGSLDSQYFCQTLLVNYVRENQVDWDIIWDDRGHFTEPHTEHGFGLGTSSVREYLTAIGKPSFEEPGFHAGKVETRGPDGRFGAVLFIEKERFMPLFERVRLAERFDMAIMSTKGMSVTAARHLVDEMCGRYKIPVFVLHDFDVSGFSIFGTLASNTERYIFKNAIKVIDIGLRLDDVNELGLESEAVSLGNTSPDKIAQRLQRNGATYAEIEFLLNERRVELNAMTSGDLVAFVERKLIEHGVAKVVPDTERLGAAYEVFARGVLVRNIFEAALETAGGDDIPVPDNLTETVSASLKEDPTETWDAVVARIAEENSTDQPQGA